MENLLIGTDKQRRRGGSLFGLLRDGSKSEEEIRIATRATILRCVGESALHADHKDLMAKVNEMTQKFVMPALQVILLQFKSEKRFVTILTKNINLSK